ncbi:polysaccharide deacetylase family protein [Kribbella qitaiheensis]|uniref:Polysaccharide deacetylase family protein n=2 Tax=Kribbella qitaiheensis TaxID=1544730 RepID=A0A7G6XAE4_9ACTN|nr:polysaccharide deacetylase family protein [Kribbella qitaiheensis]
MQLGKRLKTPARKNQREAKPAAWDLSTHGAKTIYLTFDDGPHPVYTPKVLSILAKHHAKATFFVLGREVAAHPQLVDLTRGYGNHIGNHTWDHPMLTHLTDARIRQEISSGVKSRCFRPPYRDTNKKVEAIAASYHLQQILWDVDTNDWKKPGAAAIERAILRGAHPGAIILMHDGGGNRSETVAALDRALTKLSAQGYTFRSLPC